MKRIQRSKHITQRETDLSAISQDIGIKRRSKQIIFVNESTRVLVHRIFFEIRNRSRIQPHQFHKISKSNTDLNI